MTGIRLALLLGAAALVMACGEKPQTTNASVKKTDAQAFEGADNRYMTTGWNQGDRNSWEDQLRQRTQTQNEYIKIAN